MQDEIILGTGNSRYLKSAIPSGTTWEQALEQLRAGTFPIDLNGKNSEGIAQQGTPLNKANLLSDATAAKYRFSPEDDPTPNDIFDRAYDRTFRAVLDGAWTYYSQLTTKKADNLYLATGSSAGAAAGDYIIFADGQGSSSRLSVVNAYDASLTRTNPSRDTERSNHSGASIGGYALFAGGDTSSGKSARVSAYDVALTKSVLTDLTTARSLLRSAIAGNYALFAGGYTDSSPYYSGVVNAYDQSLTRVSCSSLYYSRYDHAGASVGSYALFAGGSGSNHNMSSVEAYDQSLTRSSAPSLSVGRERLAGASAGNYALFVGGGASGGSYVKTVDAYDESLTLSQPAELSKARSYLVGASAGSCAVFAGGYYSSPMDNVDVYDSSLTSIATKPLSHKTYLLAAASVGDRALFAGGYDKTNYLSYVDAYIHHDYYELNTTIPAWCAYHIDGAMDGETVVFEDTEIALESDTPFHGYISRYFSVTGQI